MNTTKASKFERMQFLGNKILVNGMRLAANIMPIRDPKLFVGTTSLNELAQSIAKDGVKRVLLVTTAGIIKRGQADEFINGLKANDIVPVIFDGTVPDPTFKVVNAGIRLLIQESCDAIVAFGGGSAMDAAKVMAVAAANNRKPEKLIGYFKGLKKPLPFYAIPTTSGTGSEATIASVISDDNTHEKCFIIDSRTVPLAVALEPRLMEKLSPSMTAATGMDALTHAIEASVSTISTRKTDRDAEEAVKLIFENLPKAWQNGSDLEAREAMAMASYKAGKAFTKASLGYVHAISHQLGAYYGIAHGLGNAIILPKVLEYSKKAAAPSLARLAIATGIGDASQTQSTLAQTFVDHVIQLNQQLAIPSQVSELQESDIPNIAKGALKEALLNYPVPRYMGRGNCEAMLRDLMVTD